MTTERRCDVWDLPVDSCAHCRPNAAALNKLGDQLTGRTPAGVASREVAADPRFELGPVLTAPFTSWCAARRDCRIDEGDEIQAGPRGFGHVDCWA